MSYKLADIPRIVKNRFAFFRGETYEAAGKELLYRIVASEPELYMLEAIENKFEPTSYTPKPGCHVDYITPEVCKHLYLIYMELGLHKNASGEDAGACISGQETEQNSQSVRGRECKRARSE